METTVPVKEHEKGDIRICLANSHIAYKTVISNGLNLSFFCPLYLFMVSWDPDICGLL